MRRWAIGVTLTCVIASGAPATEPRDPFAPPDTVALGVEGTPLQHIELARVRLVGVVSDTSLARALLEDETGLGYVATIGTPVGRHGGVIVGLGRGSVRILEAKDDGGGGREVVLRMASSNGARK
jgi:Tfp pilus assembly protein PilP